MSGGIVTQNWISSLPYVNVIVIDKTNTYMYVGCDATIIRIDNFNSASPTVTTNWFSTTGSIRSVFVDKTNTYLYVANYSVNSVQRIANITNPIGAIGLQAPVVDITFFTGGIASVQSVVVDNTNTYIFACGQGNNNIYKNNTSTIWATLSSVVSTLMIDSTNTYMYAFYGNGIAKITGFSSATGTVNSSYYLNTSNPTFGLRFAAIDNTFNNIYISEISNRYLVEFSNTANSTPTTSILATSLGNAVNGVGIDATNTYAYVGGGSFITRVSLPSQYIVTLPSSGGSSAICFKEGTKILTKQGYILIEQLQPDDLIKTYKHGFIPLQLIGKREIEHPASNERIKNQLYQYSHKQNPFMFEDLVITGCHSILIDTFQNDEQREQTIAINGDTYVTDDKYRLPACVDENASVYEFKGKYNVYHLSMEHEDEYMNYGIYANGLLVESASTCHIQKFIKGEDIVVY